MCHHAVLSGSNSYKYFAMYQEVNDMGVTTCTLQRKSVGGCTTPTIFRVKVMFADEDNNLFPKPLECSEEILLPVTAEELEGRLHDLWDMYLESYAPYPLCFIVQEVPAFAEFRVGAFIREWIYKGGRLLSESLCCHNYGAEKFMGRPAELIRFKDGDVVNIVYDDRLSAGMVLSKPPTDTEVMQRYEEFCKDFTPKSEATRDWEAYRAFDSAPSVDCYRMLVAQRDQSFAIESVPASRVISLQLNHHLPQPLANLLTCK